MTIQYLLHQSVTSELSQTGELSDLKLLLKRVGYSPRLDPAVSWLYQDSAGGLAVPRIIGKGPRAEPLAHGKHSVCDSHRAAAFNQDRAALTGTHFTHLTPISQGKCSQPLKKGLIGELYRRI